MKPKIRSYSEKYFYCLGANKKIVIRIPFERELQGCRPSKVFEECGYFVEEKDIKPEINHNNPFDSHYSSEYYVILPKKTS